MPEQHELVFLFDVDNTLLDNDAVQEDLGGHLTKTYGEEARRRYWEIFEQLRGELGYADYLGALERYRVEAMHDPRVLRMADWLIEYDFPGKLIPGALEAVDRAWQRGTCVILSDGDAVFQPRKVVRSGLWQKFRDNVLIYIHKEQELDDVERLFPARHYVMVDDKIRILHAMKRIWGERLTTVFVRQGHYALDAAEVAKYPAADVSLGGIGDFRGEGVV